MTGAATSPAMASKYRFCLEKFCTVAVLILLIDVYSTRSFPLAVVDQNVQHVEPYSSHTFDNSGTSGGGTTPFVFNIVNATVRCPIFYVGGHLRDLVEVLALLAELWVPTRTFTRSGHGRSQRQCRIENRSRRRTASFPKIRQHSSDRCASFLLQMSIPDN